VIGFTPQQINRMTFWEFAVCVDGYNRANGGKPETTYPTDAEFESALMRLH
jgi:hypothetical protein